MNLQIRTWFGSYQFVLLMLVLDDHFKGGVLVEGEVESLILFVVVQHFNVTLKQPIHLWTLFEIVELNPARAYVRVKPDEVAFQQIKATNEIWVEE